MKCGGEADSTLQCLTLGLDAHRQADTRKAGGGLGVRGGGCRTLASMHHLASGTDTRLVPASGTCWCTAITKAARGAPLVTKHNMVTPYV
ncbi:hypothetical protein E2C01_027885 [Portunus trituberculatus]|uniref:Uncharacterized protein n=1 Tax=Portunus trituberculatus TaxID=210409 RepID=A0A5B7ENE5_PORTR|nr:hypothetical protein [Portunus trituberculatus]